MSPFKVQRSQNCSTFSAEEDFNDKNEISLTEIAESSKRPIYNRFKVQQPFFHKFAISLTFDLQPRRSSSLQSRLLADDISLVHTSHICTLFHTRNSTSTYRWTGYKLACKWESPTGLVRGIDHVGRNPLPRLAHTSSFIPLVFHSRLTPYSGHVCIVMGVHHSLVILRSNEAPVIFEKLLRCSGIRWFFTLLTTSFEHASKSFSLFFLW